MNLLVLREQLLDVDVGGCWANTLAAMHGCGQILEVDPLHAVEIMIKFMKDEKVLRERTRCRIWA